MKLMAIFILLVSVLGCATSHDPVTISVVVLHVPDFAPSYPKPMTREAAAEALGAVLPVEVTGFGSTWGEYHVIGWMRDSQGRYFGMRREIEKYEKPPKFFLGTFQPPINQRIAHIGWVEDAYQVQQDDKRLKAFSVLCLDWVDRTFPKHEHMRLRWGEPPMAEANAQYILNLYRDEREDRQQSPGGDSLKAAPQE